MKIIKQLRHSRCVIFDRGKFDEWCVYLLEENGYRKAPFDREYFSDLQMLSSLYPKDKVYLDFLRIYQQTTQYIDPQVNSLIDDIVTTYAVVHQDLLEQCFTVIYAGMIAEENKKNAILKKRIKHLGVYQILKLKMLPDVVANFSRKRSWQELDRIMRSYHI